MLGTTTAVATGAGSLTVGATTASSSTTSGALQVAGGVGIQGDLYANSLNVPSSNARINLTAGSGITLFTSLNLAGTGYTSAFYNATQHIYQVAGTEYARLDTAGDFLVGTNSAGGTGITNYPSAETQYNNNNQASGWTFLGFYRGGNAVGSVTQSGTTAVAYNTTSDKRLKTPLRSWSLGDKFDQLPIGEFNWLKTGEVAHGTLAQDLMKVYPDAVTKGDDNDVSKPYSVDYGKLTVPLIAEVKTLRSRVKTLEQDQATVLEAINQLKAEFNQYKKDHP